jgi:hypothetical protein
VKQRIAAMLGFKVFRNAAITIAAIELLHRIRKGQFALRRAAFTAELHLPSRTRCFGPEHRTAKQGLSAPAGYLHQSRFDQVGMPGRVGPLTPARVSIRHPFGRSLLVDRAPQRPSEKSRGYGNTIEANEMIAAQVPAQSPSDRSNVAINDARVSGR